MSQYSDRDYEELVHQYELLKNEFEEYKQKHPQSTNGHAAPEAAPAVVPGPGPESAAIPESPQELDLTLARLGQRIAMIIQAEKVLLMLHDSETGELFGINPAFNIPPEDVAHVRLRSNTGVAGEVFQSGQPLIVNDAMRDQRAEHDHVGLLNARNMVVVPLIIERRDAENRVTDKMAIGVLCVYNKRFGNEFTNEDVSLLRRLAGNTASIIQSARLIEKLVKENQQLTETLESIHAGILVVSSTGQVRLVNRACRTLFELPENCVNRSYTEVITDPKVRSLIERSFATRSEQTGEVTIDPSNGTNEEEEKIYQAQTGLEYEDNELVGVVAIFTDITDIRNVDRMKTAFVSTVSHELRTPLTTIKGFITTLLSLEDSEEHREFYEIIDTECDRLTRLITDLLNVSRIEQGTAMQLDLSNVDVGSVIRRVVTSQQVSDTTGHDWVVQVPDLDTVEADEDRVYQILTNIVNNAVKYSPEGGAITISARDDGNSVVVSVQDQGMGMRKEYIARGLWGKFSRERYVDNQKIYGTGLGLYLVKHMVEAHGGRIWVDSEFGRGSTFTFRIPKRQSERK